MDDLSGQTRGVGLLSREPWFASRVRRRKCGAGRGSDTTGAGARNTRPTIRPIRQSIQPTYDHRETGDRFEVETRINGTRLSVTPTRDPFVHHRVVIGWRDLLRGFLRRRLEIVVIVGGDPEIVDDVMELDADCLTFNSTRRVEWNAHIQCRLGDFGAVLAEHDGDANSQPTKR